MIKNRLQCAEVTIQVQFYDTDSLGIIYYGSYYRFFEVGFMRFLKNLGLSFSDLQKMGINLPAARSSCQYFSPSRAEETLKIKTSLKELGRASLTFAHEVRNLDHNNALAALGETKHACVNRDWKISALPEELTKKLQAH